MDHGWTCILPNTVSSPFSLARATEQLSLTDQLQAKQVNVWSVTHKDHWRRTTVAGNQRLGLTLEGACPLPIGSCNLAQGSIGYKCFAKCNSRGVAATAHRRAYDGRLNAGLANASPIIRACALPSTVNIDSPLQLPLSSQVSGLPPAGRVWRINTTRSASVLSFCHSKSFADSAAQAS